MAVPIRYLVPYELAYHAIDLGSGKKITNVIYLRNTFQTVAPPAYGAPIAGPSSNDVLSANALANWLVSIIPIMNANYKMIDLTMRSIVGKQYGTVKKLITALTAGAPGIVTTSGPHGFVTGDTVSISGVTAPPAANGLWVITVTAPDAFSLNGSIIPAGWTGDGYVQEASGNLQFVYGDKSVQISSAVGTVVGDALPLFACASVRRLSTGVGRNFRSRLSMSPVSESDSLDGGIIPARVTAINAGFANYLASPFANGGTDPTSGFSTLLAVSKKIAFTMASPFVTQSPWSAAVTLFSVQRNLGSLVRRKPKLTTPIA